mmetsp:Transcript_16184/g.35011  ORF Transcript_16184/g.35011 Transcript_16184/m.35011 type:complete len:283 (+) Transcript_16184:182-1030(+)
MLALRSIRWLPQSPRSSSATTTTTTTIQRHHPTRAIQSPSLRPGSMHHRPGLRLRRTHRPIPHVRTHIRRRLPRHGPLRQLGRHLQSGNRGRQGSTNEANVQSSAGHRSGEQGDGDGIGMSHGNVRRTHARIGHRSGNDRPGSGEHRPVRRTVHASQTPIGNQYVGGRVGRCAAPGDGMDRRGRVAVGCRGRAIGIDVVPLAIPPFLRFELDVSRGLQTGGIRDGGRERSEWRSHRGSHQEVRIVLGIGTVCQHGVRGYLSHVRRRWRDFAEWVRAIRGVQV